MDLKKLSLKTFIADFPKIFNHNTDEIRKELEALRKEIEELKSKHENKVQQ